MFFYKFPVKFRQAGMTLTETLLVLGVGAMLAVLAYGGYKMATQQVSSSSQINGTIQLVGAIKRVFGAGGNFSTVNTTNVINAKIVPDDFKRDAANIYNAWGGTIVPSVGNQAGNTPLTHFKLTVTNVPSAACIDYVTGLSGTAYSIWVGGTTAGTHDVKDINGVFHPDRAAARCSAAPTTTVVIVMI